MHFSKNYQMKIYVNLLIWIGFVIIIIAIVLFKSLSKYFFGIQENTNSKGEFLKILVQATGGVILLCGAYYSFQIVEAMNKNNELVERGNTAERFQNAISMLENDNPSFCLGGIYSLNTIALDNKDYREQVFHVLVEYVNTKTSKLDSWEEIPRPKRFYVKPSKEIETIFKLLFDKKVTIYRPFVASFENAKLYGAEFDSLNFSNCIFRNVDFQYSSFKKTWFVNSKIYGSKFTMSDIINSYFTGAVIRDSTFFDCCKIVFTKMNCCFMQDVDFSCSSIGSNFDGSVINAGIFDGVMLVEGTFNGADINIESSGGVLFGKGIVARGLRFNKGYDLGSLQSRLKSKIGMNGIIEGDIGKGGFPINKINKYDELLDIGNFIHLRGFAPNNIKYGYLQTTGWLFEDISEFTNKDYNTILENYHNILTIAE